jgi:2-hydroxychromene-2-carboxylate isomerase
MSAPVFYYDFNSPYAYLAALRVDEVLPVEPVWQPVAFGVIVKQLNKTPWSFVPAERERGQAEIARRAEQRGLPRVAYPDGWPAECYSLTPLRAALVAQDAGLLREFSRAVLRGVFVDGRRPGDLDALFDAAQVAGLDPVAAREGIDDGDVKARLRAATDDAIARGVTGVPTVAVGDELFWGDDRLEDAAAALRR